MYNIIRQHILNLTLGIKTVKESARLDPSKKNIFSQLFEFRNIAQNVCYNLYPNNTAQPVPFSKVLKKLEENKALAITWKGKENLLKNFDKLDALAGDPAIQTSIEKSIIENGININKITSDLLEFYGKQKTLAFFHRFSYIQADQSDAELDLVLNNFSAIYTPLLFEFRVRKNQPAPDSKIMLKSLKLIKKYAANKNSRPYFFLVVFTNENFQSFEKSKFRFRELLNSIKEYSTYRDQIKFIGLGITNSKLR